MRWRQRGWSKTSAGDDDAVPFMTARGGEERGEQTGRSCGGSERGRKTPETRWQGEGLCKEGGDRREGEEQANKQSKGGEMDGTQLHG